MTTRKKYTREFKQDAVRLVTEQGYNHVMHIVSNVVGRLRPGMSAMDVLRATFPAGTVSASSFAWVSVSATSSSRTTTCMEKA